MLYSDAERRGAIPVVGPFDPPFRRFIMRLLLIGLITLSTIGFLFAKLSHGEETVLANAQHALGAQGELASVSHPAADPWLEIETEPIRASKRKHLKSGRLMPPVPKENLPSPAVAGKIRFDRGGAPLEQVFARNESHLLLHNGSKGSNGSKSWRWYFQRNPLHPSRVSGALVDESTRYVLMYSSTDLEVEGVATDWSSIAYLGISPSHLTLFERTGASETAFGFPFEEWVCQEGATADLRRVWWNDELYVPLRAEGGEGDTAWSLEVFELVQEVDEAWFLNPEVDLQGYRIMDVIDYREENHLTVNSPTLFPGCCLPGQERHAIPTQR